MKTTDISKLQVPIRVLLVDDEEIIRYGLSVILQSAEKIEVIGEAEDGQQAIRLSEELAPDVLLMDINMPQMDGLTATKCIAQSHPDMKILILTTHDDAQNLSTAIQQGASGFLLKNTPPEDFIASIHQAYKGYMQLGPGLSQKLCQSLYQSSTPQSKINLFSGITPREKDVLELIAGGASNREISERLHITEKTVKNHVSHILSSVGVRDRTQLAIWANSASPNVKDVPPSALVG